MGQKIQIPKHIWNSYESKSGSGHDVDLDVNTPNASAPRLKLRLNIPVPNQTPSSQELEEDTRASGTRTHCKVKLIQFHHGGPQRQRKGQWRNQITYEQPCLHPKCPNCLKWHRRLLRGLSPQDDVEDGHGSAGSQQEAMSAEMDSGNLDGTWAEVQNRLGSIGDESVGFEAENEHDKRPDMATITNSSSHPDLQQQSTVSKYIILLPTSLVEQATSGALVGTRWRSTPRKRHMVRLAFRSVTGRKRYSQMFGMWEKRACI